MSLRLDSLVAELERLAGRLRDEDVDPDEAADLVERCAELAAEVGAELERESRAAAAPQRDEPPAGQEELL